MLNTLPKRLAALLAAMFMLVPLVTYSGSASAFQPYSVTMVTSNATSNVTCTFKVSGINALTGQVYGRLVGTISPKTFLKGLSVASSVVYCNAFGTTYGLGYAEGSRFANASSASFNIAVNVTYDASYGVCGYGGTVTKGGVTSYSPYKCV